MMSNRVVAKVRLAAASVVAAMGLLSGPQARAWKPTTHVYLAEQAVAEAQKNGGFVQIYQVDYVSGRQGAVVGRYKVDPDLLAAATGCPYQFRAGVFGPDAFPDFLIGQKAVHLMMETDTDPLHGLRGTDAWLQYIWSSHKQWIADHPNRDPKPVRAFVLGFLMHAAGDMYAHTYINAFAGGHFTLGRNMAKHMILEGYLADHTPRLNNFNVSIAGCEDFLYQYLVDARPGSKLNDLIQGSVARHTPLILMAQMKANLQGVVDNYNAQLGSYNAQIASLQKQLDTLSSNLPGYSSARDTARQKLSDVSSILEDLVKNPIASAEKALEWVKEHLDGNIHVGDVKQALQNAKNLLTTQVSDWEKLVSDTSRQMDDLRNQIAALTKDSAKLKAYSLGALLARNWIGRIETAQRAYPALSLQIGRDLFFNPSGKIDLASAGRDLNSYASTYFAPIQPSVASTLLAAGDLSLLQAAFKELGLGDPVQAIQKAAVAAGVPQDLLTALQLGGAALNGLLTEAAGVAVNDFVAYWNDPESRFDQVIGGMDGAPSPGYKVSKTEFNRNEAHLGADGTWSWHEFAPAYDTVLMCQLALLSPDEVNHLAQDLMKQPRRPNYLRTDNIMLGFLQSIDDSNQWTGARQVSSKGEWKSDAQCNWHSDTSGNYRQDWNHAMCLATPNGVMYRQIFWRERGEMAYSPAGVESIVFIPGTSFTDYTLNGKTISAGRYFDGGKVTCGIVSNMPAPAGGFTVQLSAGPIYVLDNGAWRAVAPTDTALLAKGFDMPASAIIPAGSNEVDIQMTFHSIPSPTIWQVDAVCGGSIVTYYAEIRTRPGS